MQCPTCDAILACASCRNPVEDPTPTAISSAEPLLDADGNTPFDDDDDEDEEGDGEESVSLAIGYDEDTGLIILNFGTPTSWLALSPENAEDVAKLILENIKEARNSLMS